MKHTFIHHKEFSPDRLSQMLQKATTDREREVYAFMLNYLNEGDYILQKTSGSTGKPKSIRLKKTAMRLSAQKTIHFFKLKSDQNAWLCLPMEYIAGKMMIVRAIEANMNLIISDPAGNPSIPAQAIHFTALVPMQIKNLLKEKKDLRQIDTILLGGAPVDKALKNELQEIKPAVYLSYGMTETSSHIALQKLNGSDRQPYFQALEGISIATDRDDCLIIEAPGILDEAIQTTDRVKLHGNTCFEWLGRADFVINTGGIKVSPEELEAKIETITGLKMYITSLHDQKLGQKLVLVQHVGQAFDERDMDHLKDMLGKHLSPKLVVKLEDFPYNSSMKIDRKTLQEIIENAIAK